MNPATKKICDMMRGQASFCRSLAFQPCYADLADVKLAALVAAENFDGTADAVEVLHALMEKSLVKSRSKLAELQKALHEIDSN